MKTLNLLAIDTSMEACSAALLMNGERYQEYEECPQQHSQKILPMIESLFTRSASKSSDIDFLIFGQGPGSFTGVRIACGITQGLAFGLQKRAIGISTLAALAAQTGERRVSVASDARMGEVYYGEFEQSNNGEIVTHREVVIAPELALEFAEQFSPTAIAGTGWSAYPQLSKSLDNLTVKALYPRAEVMVDLALQQIVGKTTDESKELGVKASELTPVYLRDKVTWKKLPGKE